jgi:hypothetical protein
MGKLLPAVFGILVLIAWLNDPSTGPGLNILINGAWNGFVRGVVVPVTGIVAQIAMVAGIGYVIYLIVRRHFGRR